MQIYYWEIFCVFGILSFWIPSADGNCFLPFGEEEKVYVSASGSTFNANATHLFRYPITSPVPGHTTFDFWCREKRDDRYVLQAVQEPNIFGRITTFLVCLEFQKVDNNTFYYFLGTGERHSPKLVSTTNGKSLEYDVFSQDHMIGVSQGDKTFDEICNTPHPFDQREFIMLVQEDAYENGLLTTRCPDDLLAVFLNFNVSSSTETAPNCPNNTLDVCTNRTMMSFSYNTYGDYDGSCLASTKTQSNSGNYSCLYQTTVGGSSYLALWNQDETVDGTSNYRYSCLSYRKEGGTVFATETPNKCQSTTTATNPGPNGVSLVIWNIEITCPDREPVIPEEPVYLSWIYYLVAGLMVFLLLIWLICLFIWIYKKFGCICKRIKLPKLKKPKQKIKKRLNRKPSPEPTSEIDVSKGEIVEPISFTGPIKQAPQFNMSNLFRPKKPIEDFTKLSAIFLEHNPMMLLEAPKVGPIYKDTLDDYMCGGLRRSYTQISLDSGIFEKNNGD